MSRSPELERKLAVLMSLAADDREGLPPRLRHASDVGRPRTRSTSATCGPMPGMRMSLLRILMTNACSYNCHYCPMRRDRDMPRTLLKPEELVRIFLGARQRGWCEGLFVTTGIPGRPVKVMDDLITALELLRERHRFGGYIHVKLVPGGEPAQIERLTQLASRVSVNLEAPCGASLAQIAPEKSFGTTVSDLEQVRAQLLGERAATGGGQAAGRAPPRRRLRHDHAVRGRRHARHRSHHPRHRQPPERRAAASTTPTSAPFDPSRTPRWRARPPRRRCGSTGSTRPTTCSADYGFDSEEVVFEPSGNLPLAMDPKSAWALAHPERFPIEIRTAAPEELMRVPGIGPVSARRIVAERGGTAFRTLADLRKLGVVTNRAAGFLTLSGPPAADRAMDPAARLLGAGRGGRARTTWCIRSVPGTFR